MTLAPLHLHFLAHPKSEVANKIAAGLMRRFIEPPLSGGLRIPVYFTPDRGTDLPPVLDNRVGGLDLDSAEHTVVVILGDERMLRVVAGGTGQAWIAFTQEALTKAPVGHSPHHILPVALDEASFGLSQSVHILPALLETDMEALEAADRRLAEISFHIAALGIQLLADGVVSQLAPDRMKAPVRIFFSHAKADLDRDGQDPVGQTRELITSKALPIEAWYDTGQIATGQAFAEAIEAGIRDCSIMLAFHTDHYGSRPWCRREVLDAKRMGAHILIVDALETGEPRSFPYSGNAPIIRWQFRDPRLDARQVLDRAVLEALRFKHNRAWLERMKDPGEEIIAAPPEAVTLANLCEDATKEATFLYPDPPLGREELEVLQRLRPKVKFVTPLTKIAQHLERGKAETIAVSISESDDVRWYGLSKEHVDTLSDEIHLYLLLAGLKIAYGGVLKGGSVTGSNFTLRLFELVRAYSRLAEDIRTVPLENSVVNIAPWPLRLNYGEADWALFTGDVALFIEGPRPDLPWSDDEIFPPNLSGREIGSDTAERRYAWARGLTAMRQSVTQQSKARLVLGGKLKGFSGLVPGVIEESWISMKSRQALFLAGGFGGAARAVSDMLLGDLRPEFSADWARQNIPDHELSRQLYGKHGGCLPKLDQMGADFAAWGKAGLSAALNNGLDDGQNRDLMLSTDPQRIAQLVLTGLGRL